MASDHRGEVLAELKDFGRSKTPVPSDVAEINENPWAPEGLGFGAPIPNSFLLGI